MVGQALELWEHDGLDFDELGWDLASEVRIVRRLNDEITRLETRIDELYAKADPAGIVITTPWVGRILAGGIPGTFVRVGDRSREREVCSTESCIRRGGGGRQRRRRCRTRQLESRCR